jgi:predicted RNA-binding Zn ribbon-like protein
MTSRTGSRYAFDPGAFSLELLLTGGPEPWEHYEILDAPAVLADWLTGSRLAAFAPLTVDDLRIRPAELTRIKAFRDALWRIVPSVVDGDWRVVPQTGRDPADVALINDSVGTPPRPRLDPVSGKRGWATPVTGTQVLAAAAADAIDLLGGDRLGRLRQCQGGRCYLVFLDTSRPGNRRWCSMQHCGNLHKVSSYRSRRD